MLTQGRAASPETRLRLVTEANAELAAAQQGQTATIVCVARHRLQDAVDAARDVGVDWTQIGDVLGIPRGSAYQRFRMRGKRTNR